MTEQNTPVSTEPSQKDLDAMGISPEAIILDDVNVLGNLATGWHFQTLNDLFHKSQMPPDVGIDIPTGKLDAEGNEEVIEGNEDHKAGFLAGIAYAIELMNTFPIKGVPEDGEDA